jgi:hypothetical protein
MDDQYSTIQHQQQHHSHRFSNIHLQQSLPNNNYTAVQPFHTTISSINNVGNNRKNSIPLQDVHVISDDEDNEDRIVQQQQMHHQHYSNYYPNYHQQHHHPNGHYDVSYPESNRSYPPAQQIYDNTGDHMCNDMRANSHEHNYNPYVEQHRLDRQKQQPESTFKPALSSDLGSNLEEKFLSFANILSSKQRQPSIESPPPLPPYGTSTGRYYPEVSPPRYPIKQATEGSYYSAPPPLSSGMSSQHYHAPSSITSSSVHQSQQSAFWNSQSASISEVPRYTHRTPERDYSSYQRYYSLSPSHTQAYRTAKNYYEAPYAENHIPYEREVVQHHLRENYPTRSNYYQEHPSMPAYCASSSYERGYSQHKDYLGAPQPFSPMEVTGDLLSSLREVPQLHKMDTHSVNQAQHERWVYNGPHGSVHEGAYPFDASTNAALSISSPKVPINRHLKQKATAALQKKKAPAEKKTPLSAKKKKGSTEKKTKETKSKKLSRKQQQEDFQPQDELAYVQHPKSYREGLRTRTEAQQKKQKEYLKLLDDEYDPMEDEGYYLESERASKKKSTSKITSKKGSSKEISDSESSDLEELLDKESVFTTSDNFCFSNSGIDLLSDTALLTTACVNYLNNGVKSRLQYQISNIAALRAAGLQELGSKEDAATAGNKNVQTVEALEVPIVQKQTSSENVVNEVEQSQSSKTDETENEDSLQTLIDLSAYNCARFNWQKREKKLEELRQKRSISQDQRADEKNKRRKLSTTKIKPTQYEPKIRKSKLKMRSGLDIYEVFCATKLSKVDNSELESGRLNSESEQVVANAHMKQRHEIELQLQKAKESQKNKQEEQSIDNMINIEQLVENMSNIPSIYYYLTQHTATNNVSIDNEQQQQQPATRSRKCSLIDAFKQTQDPNNKSKPYRLNAQQLISEVYSLPKKEISKDLKVINGKVTTSRSLTSQHSLSNLNANNRYSDRSMDDLEHAYYSSSKTRSGKKLNGDLAYGSSMKKSNRRTARNTKRNSSPKRQQDGSDENLASTNQQEETIREGEASVAENAKDSQFEENNALSDDKQTESKEQETNHQDYMEVDENGEKRNEKSSSSNNRRRRKHVLQKQQSQIQHLSSDSNDDTGGEHMVDQETEDLAKQGETAGKEASEEVIKEQENEEDKHHKNDPPIDKYSDQEEKEESDNQEKEDGQQLEENNKDEEEEEEASEEEEEEANNESESEEDEVKDKSYVQESPTTPLRNSKKRLTRNRSRHSFSSSILSSTHLSELEVPNTGRYNTRSSERRILATVASLDAALNNGKPENGNLPPASSSSSGKKRRIRRTVVIQPASTYTTSGNQSEQEKENESSDEEKEELPKRKHRQLLRNRSNSDGLSQKISVVDGK